MKNISKLILGLLVIASYNENAIASSKEHCEENELPQVDISDNTITKLQNINNNQTLTMENYINKIIKDIRSSLLSFMFVKTYISNPIEILDRYYPYHINRYGEFPNSLLNGKFIEFANNDINVFIELLKSNNTEIQITNLHEKVSGICNKLIQTLENSSVNNSSTFTDILQFLENTSNDNKQKMQNNIEIVKSMKNEEKEHLVRFLESKFKCIIEPVFFVSLLESGFEFSINQIIKKVVEPKINKLNCIIKNLNELSNVINDNRIIEINNKLLLITNNILEYLQLTKECLYEIGLNSTGRFLSSCFSFDLRINKDRAIAAYLTWF